MGRATVLKGLCPVSWQASSRRSPCSHARPRPPLAQPNVVVIMTDDQTAATVPMMPQLNAQLANEGTNFEQAIASFPLCCPSRATNLTGQYAHNHGVLHNAGLFGGFACSTTRTPCRCGSARPATGPCTWAAT